MGREANAVVAQLMERDVRLSEEIGRAWGEITSTATLYKKLKEPEFDRIKYLDAKSPERRAMSARLFSQKYKDEMEKHDGPGILNNYDDVCHLKQYLETWPSAPYWRRYKD